MRITLLVYIILLFFISQSCGTDENTTTQTEELTAQFFDDSKIISVRNELDISMDEDLKVFRYYRLRDSNGFLDGDELENEILFQIDSDITEFELIDEQLKDAFMHFKSVCSSFCTGEFIEICIGTLRGNQLPNGNWEVEIDIKYEDDVSFGITQIFEPG